MRYPTFQFSFWGLMAVVVITVWGCTTTSGKGTIPQGAQQGHIRNILTNGAVSVRLTEVKRAFGEDVVEIGFEVRNGTNRTLNIWSIRTTFYDALDRPVSHSSTYSSIENLRPGGTAEPFAFPPGKVKSFDARAHENTAGMNVKSAAITLFLKHIHPKDADKYTDPANTFVFRWSEGDIQR